MRALLATVLVASWCPVAFAHSDGPAAAQPHCPEVGWTVVDESYELCWTDDNTDEAATFDFAFAPEQPPTFQPWECPETRGFEGTTFATDVEAVDETNCVQWDTSEVPSGGYWVWSHSYDFPFEICSCARCRVVVAHEGDELPPVIVLDQSDEIEEPADDFYLVHYRAYDPDGTATVRLEVTDQADGSGLMEVVSGLPAGEDATYRWDTSEVPTGQFWTLKATITDARGQSASAWGCYFLRIYHYDDADVGSDAGGSDVGLDAGVDASAVDATEPTDVQSPAEPAPTTQDCGCGLGSSSPKPERWFFSRRR